MSEVQALVECPVIVGTAGHVDHGKSALIEALTGKNPDRLEVERRRGMTVELGFGELALPSGKIVGLVDVPGHAHYLRAMVQGATGIDVAVLVVSAVEGVMPQTREHVHVLELLGLRHMVVALTMCDLADSEMIELAELDVDDFLRTPCLRTRRSCPCRPRPARESMTCWLRSTSRLPLAGMPAVPVASSPMPHRVCPSTAALRSRAPVPW
mgnify:FL=1